MTALLPDPPVPTNADLKNFPFTPIYRARLFGSSFNARVNDAEWRAGVTLWLKSQDQTPAGSLPDDDTELCRLAEFGRELKKFRKIKSGALHGWYKCRDGRLYNDVVAEVVLSQWEGKEEQRGRTLKARIAALQKRLEQQQDEATKEETRSQIEALRLSLKQHLSQRLRQGEKSSVTDSVTDPVTASNREGEGEGEGKGKGIYKKLTSRAGADAPSSEVHPALPENSLSGPPSDEDRFWALAPKCEAKGITRSRLGKLLKLVAAGATTMPAACKLVAASLRAKEPSTYFGAAVRQIEVDADLVKPKSGKCPPWVDEWRAAGEQVVSAGLGQWKARGNVYDESGGLIGW